ncbi:unnamed protein product [Prorocentrum cordatum]|uniref:Uncharacterized protein n=1 Tax=Prorocentrum cordatum TaxID=2364126 RepID=A0ABN9Q4T5_9DINO|nr:unnamed protein product [Polarella glacialis]
MDGSPANPRLRRSGGTPAPAPVAPPGGGSPQGRTPARRPETYELSPRPWRRAAAACRGALELPFWFSWGLVVVMAAMLPAFLFGKYVGKQHNGSSPHDADADNLSCGGNQSCGSMGALARLSEERLRDIASNLRALQGLSQVVVKADDTYEEVYHRQLIRQDLDDVEPGAHDWNSFVVEARASGPDFLEGKECLRDAVANMHRLIRRAPDYLRSLLHHLREDDAEEASWYLAKVVKLVDTIKESMERAAAKFGEVDSSVGGMARDALENEQHLHQRASKLIGEARALAEGRPARSGSWGREANVALYGCQLGKTIASLEDCKLGCVGHDSGSCTQISYYKTAPRNNCYFHCESATRGPYDEADVFSLEKAPDQVAVDIHRREEVGLRAEQLRGRWQQVQGPLGEVTRLVRRFRLATMDLRKSLEDVRFASSDLQAAVAGPSGDRHLRLLERRVGDLVDSIEDFGDSLAPLRL